MLKIAHRPLVASLMIIMTTLLVVGMIPESAAAGDRVKPERYVSGWLPYWNPTGATASVTQNAALFADASPFVFSAVSARDINLQLSSYSWDSMRQALRAKGVPIIATVTTDMSAGEFADVLSSREKRAAHVDALVGLVHKYRLRGIDLDYESINFGSSAARATVRTYYPRLLRMLDRRLDARRALTSVTVAARTSAGDPNWWVFDYKALGAEADRVRIMTYDYSWSGGAPGPIAPKYWVKEVAAYAAQAIAPRKVSLGMPAYGRDWFGGTVSGKCPASAKSTISRSTRDMVSFARSIGVKPVWRKNATSAHFTYVKKYTSGGMTCRAERDVWFDNARSWQAKTPLVDRFGLRGIAIWALGSEGAAAWPTLTQFGRQLARAR
jgi:spore germination protein YaaH